jgi:hypothetical protein
MSTRQPAGRHERASPKERRVTEENSSSISLWSSGGSEMSIEHAPRLRFLGRRANRRCWLTPDNLEPERFQFSRMLRTQPALTHHRVPLPANPRRLDLNTNDGTRRTLVPLIATPAVRRHGQKSSGWWR